MYDIYNVTHREDDYGNVGIYFFLSGHRFCILVDHPYEGSTKYRLRSVYHETGKTCPFCKKSRLHRKCEALYKDTDVLFKQLISINTLRLPWLFREYEKI